MLSFTGSAKIYIALAPCDMRKSFNGLYTEVVNTLDDDPKSSALFAFTNKRRNRIKILYWDGTGLWVLAKRLEKGSFSWPSPQENDTAKIELEPSALAMLTDGVDLKSGTMRPWYERG